MNKLLFLVLLSTFCFSQEKEVTIKLIDSICTNKGFYGSKNGKIKDEGKIKGNSYFSISTYVNDFELIKSNYFEFINFTDGASKEIFGYFYYQNMSLIFIKVKVYKKDKNKESESQEFHLTDNDIKEGKPIKNLLLFDVQSWIQKKNIEILKFYNNK